MKRILSFSLFGYSALALALVLIAVAMPTAGAGTAPGLPADPQYKYSTPNPPGVAIPDQVETRLGTLHFDGGVPDEATSDKLYDNLDFQRALQAYLLALPPVNQLANRMSVDGAGEQDRADLGTTGGLSHRGADGERQHGLQLVLGGSARRPASARGAPEGAWADRRHVVPLRHQPRLHRARQGARRQVSAAPAGLRGRSTARLSCRSMPDLQRLARLA